jgi:hypothetical protein
MMGTGRGFAVLSAIVALGLTAAPSAHADDWGLNGTFRATSNGDFAKTNDVYHDEVATQSVWTITMACTDQVTCAGTVVSDAGWTADITTHNGEYRIKRQLPNWEPCADGSGRTVTGHQMYRFWPTSSDGYVLPGSPVFAGFDTTSGESGGCSVNEKLQIQMPFRLERLS